MIANQVKGTGFRGTLAYVLGKDGADKIGGNTLGESVAELSAEFSESRKLRPNMTRAVYHTSLSLAAGERLSDEKWNEVTKSYLDQMGFQGSQYVVVRHKDTPHDHIHIVASRVRMTDGSVVSESQDYKRSEGILRGIEKEYGLKQVTPSREVDHRAPSHGELELARQGVPSIRLRLQSLVDGAITDRPTMSTFLSRMDDNGVSVIPNQAATGHISGVTFLLDGEPMKGSDLGRGYTWAGLQKRGVNYDQIRDRQRIGFAKEQGELAWAHARASSGVPGQSGVQPESHHRDHESGHKTDGRLIGGAQHTAPGTGDLQLGVQEGQGSHAARTERNQPNGERNPGPHPGRGNQAPMEGIALRGRDHALNRSTERLRILQLAAESIRRQRSTQTMEGVSGKLAAPQPGESKKGLPDFMGKSKALEALESEIEEVQHEQKREQLEREKKLQQEREFQSKQDMGRGRSREIGFGF